MTTPKTDQIRRYLHMLREPLGSLSLNIGLLETVDLSAQAQVGVKSMRTSMERAQAVFDDLDFLLENGHPRPDSVIAAEALKPRVLPPRRP